VSVLPAGLPVPIAEPDGLSEPYWSGLQQNVLRIQRCNACGKFQWGPEWICHHCHSFALGWVEIPPRGRIHSWERAWHAVHPALRTAVPYVVVLVDHELGIRLLGNLIGPPERDVVIGDSVDGVFEHHAGNPRPFSLLHWQRS
jgi:uncharacterized OB-fold protein